MDDSGVHGMCQSTPNCFIQKGRRSVNIFPTSPIVPIHSSTLNGTVPEFDVNTPNFNAHKPAASSSIASKVSPSEFYSNHHASLQKTPVKACSSSKLGSPERNEIISGRKPTGLKWVTPRLERSSPAKRNLFPLHHLASGGAVRKNTSILAHNKKYDPVVELQYKHNVWPVMEKIFLYLNKNDLYNCTRVSQIWRNTVMSFSSTRQLVIDFEKRLEVDKENPGALKDMQEPMDVEQDDDEELPQTDKFIKLARTLNENQSLKKCPFCEHPQIVECSIAQCQNANCRYICCLRCDSYSLNGPEYFVNKCNGGKLQVHVKRRTLMDSPPHSQFSFMHSPPSVDNSHLYAGELKDSCYGTLDDSKFGSFSDKSGSFSRSRSFLHTSHEMHQFGRLLSNLNCDGDNAASSKEANLLGRRAALQRTLYTPVVPTANGRSPPRPLTPECSPVKDYRGACTKRSKKQLRRLLK